ncbi:MAG: hypothetical protein D6815_01155, partial [Candidatus Dadabacteria bacterium]
MNGSARKRSIRSAVLAMLIATALTTVATAAPATVLIVKSDDLVQYNQPIESFRARIERPVAVVNLAGKESGGERILRQRTRGLEIDAVFALGGHAAYLARKVFPATPTVFAMVLNRDRVDLRGPVTGVDVQLPVESLLARFKLLMPGLKRIGVIHSRVLGDAAVDRLRKAASAVQIEVVTATVRHSEDVAGAYRRIRGRIDALWMVPDPVVVTRDNFAYLSHRTRNDGIAFLAFSENFVRAGALMSVSPSYDTIGEQAAVLLERLME